MPDYVVSWESSAEVYAYQDFTKLQYRIIGDVEITPAYSGAVTTTYNIYTIVEGVQTLIYTGNYKYGTFSIPSGDIGKVYTIAAEAVCVIQHQSYETDMITADVSVEEPEIYWSDGAYLSFTTNNPDGYSPSSTYEIGDTCRYYGKIYECTTDINTPENWTPSHWTDITSTYQYQGTITLHGDALYSHGRAGESVLFELINVSDTVVLYSGSSNKSYTFNMASPTRRITYALNGYLVEYNEWYQTETPLTIVGSVTQETAQYYAGETDGWIPCDTFYWDGTDWIECDVLYWDGTNWINC